VLDAMPCARNFAVIDSRGATTGNGGGIPGRTPIGMGSLAIPTLIASKRSRTTVMCLPTASTGDPPFRSHFT
jgi:hypothetical protein